MTTDPKAAADEPELVLVKPNSMTLEEQKRLVCNMIVDSLKVQNKIMLLYRLSFWKRLKIWLRIIFLTPF